MNIPTYPADDALLLETRLEHRDGDTWVTGLCSFCWERLGFRGLEPGSVARCKNGHAIRVLERQCVGACAAADMAAKESAAAARRRGVISRCPKCAA